MAVNKIVGYKNIFGFVLPDWVDEGTIRMIVTLLLSSAVMLFVLIFVIWPKLPEITQLRSALKADQEALASLTNSKAGFDQLNSQIPESTQNIVLSAIPLNYAPENAIFLLRQLSNDTPGLSIVSYKLPPGVVYDTTEQKPNDSGELVSFAVFPIKLQVTAPVPVLLSFVNKVETALPFGVVSDLGLQEITKAAGSSASRPVQMDLEISYYQAILRQVDITKLKPITPEDLALVKEISGFTQAGAAEGGAGSVLVATGSANTLFGF